MCKFFLEMEINLSYFVYTSGFSYLWCWHVYEKNVKMKIIDIAISFVGIIATLAYGM